jgi:hypothetical protein
MRVVLKNKINHIVCASRLSFYTNAKYEKTNYINLFFLHKIRTHVRTHVLVYFTKYIFVL